MCHLLAQKKVECVVLRSHQGVSRIILMPPSRILCEPALIPMTPLDQDGGRERERLKVTSKQSWLSGLSGVRGWWTERKDSGFSLKHPAAAIACLLSPEKCQTRFQRTLLMRRVCLEQQKSWGDLGFTKENHVGALVSQESE